MFTFINLLMWLVLVSILLLGVYLYPVYLKRKKPFSQLGDDMRFAYFSVIATSALISITFRYAAKLMGTSELVTTQISMLSFVLSIVLLLWIPNNFSKKK